MATDRATVILLIYADALIRAETAEALRAKGCQVDEVASTHEAVALMKSKKPPTAILLGLTQPEAELTEFMTLKTSAPGVLHIPVFALADSLLGGAKAAAFPADGYFSVPLVVEAFLEILRRWG